MDVQRFLQERGVAFEVLPHDPTFSAQRMAEAVHTCGDNVAKMVLVKADGKPVLTVMPATHHLYLEMAREALGATRVELASEPDLKRFFPDCEVGALSPFGSQYGMRTLVDASLTEDEEIVFESNAHRVALRMKYQAFEELERPQIALFAYHDVAAAHVPSRR
jgi:Ala-tRNA(Pro) deacylase